MTKKHKQKQDFDYYIGEYIYDCQSRHLRPKTLNSYEQTLRLFERWAKEQEKIDSPTQVVEQTIRHYICDLKERGKYSFYANEEQRSTNFPERRRDFRDIVSITTINNYIRNLKAFFNWFEDENTSNLNPMRKIKQIKAERKAKEFLEDEEVRKLLNCFDRSYFSECRDVTITTLLLDTGMRIGECLMLSVKHLDMSERVIELPASLTKGRKDRYVYFSIKTARLLSSWLRFKDRYVETDYLFPTKENKTPLEIRTFETNFRKYISRAGITKDVSPHTLRNNFAKRCILAGMDIYTLSRILGHSSVTVTEKAYLDLTDRDIRRCYQNFSPMEHIK